MDIPADQSLPRDDGCRKDEIVDHFAAMPLPKQFFNEKNLVYHGDEHQVYILPENDVNNFMHSMSMTDEIAGFGHNKWWNGIQQKRTEQYQHTMLQEVVSGIDDTPDSGYFAMPYMQQEFEKIVNEHNIVQVGNESIYILPDPGGAEQLVRSLGNRQGDFSRSNMWSRTKVDDSNVESMLSEILKHVRTIEAQIKHLASLIKPAE